MSNYNISELRNGVWWRRYRNNLTLLEAKEKFDWLTGSEYWMKLADAYAIIRIDELTTIIERSDSDTKTS